MRLTALCSVALACLWAAAPAHAVEPGTLVPAAPLVLAPDAVPSGSAGSGAVSDDGRSVAFTAQTDGLVDGAPLDTWNVFRRDLQTDEIELISRADGPAGAPATRDGSAPKLTDSGRYVAWATDEALDPTDTDGTRDIYVRDTATDTTRLVDDGGGGSRYEAGDYAISGDDGPGDPVYVAFSQSPIYQNVPSGTVYRVRLGAGEPPEPVVQVGGQVRSGSSPSINDDGSLITYNSTARDLVSPAYPSSWGPPSTYLRNMAPGGFNELVSRARDSDHRGVATGAAQVAGASTATDWTVVYTSDSHELVARQEGVLTERQAFRRTSAAPTSELISPALPPPERGPFLPDLRSVSVDDSGTRFAFVTETPTGSEAYHRDLGSEPVRLEPAGHFAVAAGISGDGEAVLWQTQEGGLAGDDDGIPSLLLWRQAGGPVVSIARPAGNGPAQRVHMLSAGLLDVSDHGRYVLFSSSPRLGAPHVARRLYRRDVLSGTTELVSRADGPSGAPLDVAGDAASISADGRRVGFATADRVLVRDVPTGRTITTHDGYGSSPALSGDGRYVAWLSGDEHVHRTDLETGSTVLVDRTDGRDGAVVDRPSSGPVISDDGDVVAFRTWATNVSEDGLERHRTVVRRIDAGETDIANLGPDGAPASDSSTRRSLLSGDGRWMVFAGGSGTLVLRDLVMRRSEAVPAGPLGEWHRSAVTAGSS